MAFDFASAGSFLSGLGNIAGAFGGKGKGAGWQADLQREFAQNTLQWRAEDARKAGIHPVYAMGSNLPSATPVQYDGGGTDLAQLGQGLGRAVDAVQSKQERGVKKIAQNLELERMKLQNELLKTQISNVARSNQPAFPSRNTTSGDLAGQGDQFPPYGMSVDSPASNSTRLIRNVDGSISVLPSRDVADAIESAGIPTQLEWWARNSLPYHSKQLIHSAKKPFRSKLTPQEIKQIRKGFK